MFSVDGSLIESSGQIGSHYVGNLLLEPQNAREAWVAGSYMG